MLEKPIAGFGVARLKYRTVHPTMALVVDGISALQVGKAAVLRFQVRLQVRRVVNGMGPGVTGKPFKPSREALREINGQTVIVGATVGKLGIHAIERHRHGYACTGLESAWIAGHRRACSQESRGEARRLGRSYQPRVAYGARAGEGRIGPGLATIIESLHRCHWRVIKEGQRRGATAQRPEDSRDTRRKGATVGGGRR